MIGKRLAHFEITAKLGEGGMGEVYRATDTKLEREVAVKLLPAAMSGDPELLERFKREARTVAALNHPNIVTIHSVEEADGLQLLTMELVDGKTLDEVIPSGGLPLQELFDLAIPVADALSEAHAKGITHRDLKPANVMVTPKGQTKILDFGLAKLAEGSGAGASGDARTEALTQNGLVVGTVRYMSPEQARGEPADHRSDVFSLGVLLYEMTTGRHPFQGKSSVELLSSILKDEPTLVTELREDLPNHLGRIVRRCLEKEPAKRYPSAADVRNELEDLKREIDSGRSAALLPTTVQRPAQRTKAAIWLVLALVAAALLSWWALSGRNRKQTAELADQTAVSETMRMRRLMTLGNAKSAAISPDGTLVAYVLDAGGKQSLRMLQIETASDIEIVAAAQQSLSQPSFSPDGNYVYFIRRDRAELSGVLYRVPSLGGQPQRIAEDAWSAPAFSPNGDELAFGRLIDGLSTQALVVSGLEGENPREITRGQGVDFLRTDRAPSWSPDGELLALIAGQLEPTYEERVATVRVDNGELELLDHDPWRFARQVSWSPGGRELLASGGIGPSSLQIWRVSYPRGGRRRITNDLNSYSVFSVTADGLSMVAIREQRDRHLWIAKAGESSWEMLSASDEANEGHLSLAWTSQSELLFGYGSSGGEYGLATIEVEDSSRHRLRRGGFNPSLCGADRVVFVTFEGGTAQVWEMLAAGGEAVRLTSGGFDVTPNCTPDGRFLFYRDLTEEGSLRRTSLEDGETRVIARGEPGSGWGQVTISPNGKLVAFTLLDKQDGLSKAAVAPTEGGDVRLYDIPGFPLAWSPDGKALDFVRTENDVSNVWRQPLDGSDPEQVTHFNQFRIHALAWSPDGSHLAVTRGRDRSDVVLIENF